LCLDFDQCLVVFSIKTRALASCVQELAVDPTNLKAIITGIHIAFDCDCTTPCGYVHTDQYEDQVAISKAYEKMGLV